ncbi:podocalyxin [Rhinichthys klamathensis goyatoka]|uniref:podocalyxin n=1 Tax=Rhinichthys klamathensis goyatoka TaxID=3034132 RepID=UPI0024B4FF59|nr:podocalyxin [Rhinichthys klamathensis goyatoka]
MAITWTIIVLGALLHDMQCASADSTLTTSQNTTNSISSTTSNPSSTNSPNPPSTTSSNPPTSNLKSTHTPTASDPATPTPVNPSTITSSNPTTPTPVNPSTITSLNPTITILSSPSTPLSLSPTSLKPTIGHADTSLTSLTTEETTQQQSIDSDSPQQDTTQITTIQPTTTNTKATSKESNLSSQNTPSPSQDTTSSNKPATTTHKESGTTPVNEAKPSAVTTNPAPNSTSAVSESIQTTEAQATSAPITSVDPATSTSTPGNITYPVFDLSSSSEGNIVFETCKKLGKKVKGNCSVTLEIQGNQLIATVKINADQKIPTESYKPPEKVRRLTDNNTVTLSGSLFILKHTFSWQKVKEVSEETIPDTLIAILASSGALVLILCCFAAYCTYHRRSYRKNQQHLTEEMQTVENGYHDNPTLEVMEVQPEMQEKKLALNGEFNDSWIVPIDNLLKEDIPDEEDTHL